jgi:hypothetical protein
LVSLIAIVALLPLPLRLWLPRARLWHVEAVWLGGVMLVGLG